MNELQSVTDIDEVIKYAEREAEGCHQTASAFHTDEGVYIHEETRFQYKAILWENIHEWLEELKERRKKQRPHGEWIPCSKRLPEEIGDYLVTEDLYDGVLAVYVASFGHVRTGKLCFYYEDEDGRAITIDDIVAWMPLPDPYREETSE